MNTKVVATAFVARRDEDELSPRELARINHRDHKTYVALQEVAVRHATKATDSKAALALVEG
jgi:hypothetical protein